MPAMTAKLGLKEGIISTGDSVHADPSDLERLQSNKAACKEMEAAAIAEVAQFCNIPMIALKVITDYVDSQERTYAQFLRNYQVAMQALTEKVAAALDFILGKAMADL